MIYLGSDHGGFQLKEDVKEWVAIAGWPFEDLGATALVDGDDYPQYAFAVAKKVAENTQQNSGILICKSGGGMTIAANRIKGVRAVDCLNRDEVIHARQDNNANVITIPALWVAKADALMLVQLWFTTPFSGEERHVRRVDALDKVK